MYHIEENFLSLSSHDIQSLNDNNVLCSTTKQIVKVGMDKIQDKLACLSQLQFYNNPFYCTGKQKQNQTDCVCVLL